MIAKVFYPARLPSLDCDAGGVFVVCTPETSIQNLQKAVKISRACDRPYDPPGDLVLIAEPSELKQSGFHEDVA
jgi:hypothetical protein